MSSSFKRITLQIITVLLLLVLLTSIQNYLDLPAQQKISVGDELSIGLNYPEAVKKQLSIQIKDEKGILKKENNSTKQFTKLKENSFIAFEPGKINLHLKLFGVIPFKSIHVDVVPDIKVYPGGQSVGVLLRTQGVLIVGQSPIIDEQGNSYYPAKEAGIRIGDSIIKVNDINIQTDEELAKLINMYGDKDKKIILTVKRNNNIVTKEIVPIFCQETKSYRIGLFVRDNAGGVGTLTFYEPINQKYGALGHMISDSETKQKINIKNGKIVRASIEGISKGKKGQPGEKIGSFIDNTEIGKIEVNSIFGIFGSLNNEKIANGFYTEPLSVAFANQVNTGHAEILTVIKGEKVEKFSIEIERLMPRRYDGKTMIIKITDPRLLRITGGIVQGMSGSPIIQNGKIVGAITHVFVNDPTRGYGNFIEDMLNEAGILTQQKINNLGA